MKRNLDSSTKSSSESHQNQETNSRSYEISRHEENLRKKFELLNLYAEEDLHKTSDRNDHRFAKLEKRISNERRREEEKIAREASSRLFNHNPALYFFLSPFLAIGRFVEWIWGGFVLHRQRILTKRPHQSFRMTPRAKTRRGIKMSGYFGFIGEVWHVIWRNKWLFAKFILIYSAFAAIVIGVLNQQNFVSLRDSLNSLSSTSDFAKNVALFSGAVTGIFGTSSSTSVQQVLSILLILYGFLTLIWLMRALLNGEKPKLRDGLYNSGGQVLALTMIALVILLQLVPFAIVLMAYSSLTSVGILNNGIMIENMAAWCALAVAAILTLYWLCSSLIAMIIVTLPGVYPMEALRAAGDLVTSRRISVVLRIFAMAIPVVVIWIVVLLPAIWLDGLLEAWKITWLPLVPFVVLLLSSVTLVFVASYIYMLYRRMVDDPTPPVSSDWKTNQNKFREVHDCRKNNLAIFNRKFFTQKLRNLIKKVSKR